MAWYAQGIHAIEAGHLIEDRSVVPGVQARDEAATVFIGRDAVVQGAIVHAGGVVLSRGAQVWRGIDAGHEVTIGAHVRIKGPVLATGRVTIQHGAQIHGDVSTDADVLLLGDCVVGDVKAGGDIVIVGAPKTGQLLPGGRVQTRPW